MNKDGAMAQEELDKKIEKKIEEKLHRGEIDKKIEEEIGKEIEKDIKAKVSQRVDQAMGMNQQSQTSRVSNFFGALLNFKSTFRFCWQGTCRSISFLFIFAYIVIAALILLCRIPNMPFCFQGGAGPLIIITAVIVLAISFLISILSSEPRTSLLYTILLGVPILIMVFISSIQYIGLIIAGSALLILIIRLIKR